MVEEKGRGMVEVSLETYGFIAGGGLPGLQLASPSPYCICEICSMLVSESEALSN